MNDAAPLTPLTPPQCEPVDRAAPFAGEKMDSTRTPTTAAAIHDDAFDGDDVDAMVATMQRSARQLDEMLQRMCAAAAVTTATSTSDDESDDADTKGLQPVNLLTASETAGVSCQSYFEAIRASFLCDQRSAGVHRVGHQALHGLAQTEEMDSKKADNKTFLVSTTDVTFMFPVSSVSYTTITPHEDGEDLATEEWDMAEALTLEEFQCRIVDALEKTDRAMPPTVAKAMTTAMAENVVRFSQADCELKAIGVLFPVTSVQPDTSVEWRRGNRICKVLAVEKQWRRQWGVELTLTLETVARAQGVSVATRDEAGISTARLGPAISCAVKCRSFVPKTSYKTTTLEAVPVQATLTLSLTGDGDRGSDTDETVSLQADTTLSAELPEFLNVYQWGGHAGLSPSGDTSMAVPATFHASTGFQRLDIQAPFPRNRIVQAACGRLHTLLLSDAGMVFSYGHAMDGALGHGDTLGRTEVVVPQPKLIEYFLETAVAIQSVACGGDDLTGFHSAAVARDGRVFTWGVGVALGLGSVKSKSSPTRVTVPTAMASISCGSGFCVALAGDGAAFAWGKWSDGRLGLGAIPILNRSPSGHHHHGQRRQLQRFQLYPKPLAPTTKWRNVSCGDAHCVALSRSGRVYVWGRGRQGQLGLGDGRDAMAPVALLPKKKAWRDVAAGQDWSMAVDAKGAVWSWGACGGAVLGLSYGDDADRGATVAEVLLQKHFQLRQQSAGTKGSVTPPPRFHWLRPQPIPSLSHRDVAVKSISAGARHAAAISERGDLYVWGSPQQGLSSQPTLVLSTGDDDDGNKTMGATIAEKVFCGGSHVVVLTSGSFLARAMQHLYQTLQVRPDDNGSGGLPPRAVAGAADVALIVGGGTALFAHRLVLARRSPVLRDLIRNEERPMDAETDTSWTVTEVLLPHVRVEIARVLLEFLYTDNLTTSLDPLSYLIRDVLRCAREFRIPRLVAICRARIASASYVPLGTLLPNLQQDEEQEDEQEQEQEGARRGHSLNDDLAFAFGDATFADLRIVAEHCAIPVHRCLLIARSAYFRALLAFYDQQDAPSRRHPRELVVDESYAGMIRVLNFMYHDELTSVAKQTRVVLPTGQSTTGDADEPTEQLLEDLIAADKYGLVRMKRLCEHHIIVTTNNCLDVLVVADLVHALHLKQVALAFVHANLHMLNDTVLPRLAHEFPHLLTELYDRLHRHTQQHTLLRDWQRHVANDACVLQQRQHEQWQHTHGEHAAHAQSFPWVPLLLAFVFAVLYLSVMNARESDYAVVPAVNLVVVGGLLAAAFLGKV